MPYRVRVDGKTILETNDITAAIDVAIAVGPEAEVFTSSGVSVPILRPSQLPKWYTASVVAIVACTAFAGWLMITVQGWLNAAMGK